jgi:hypothetical protein
MKLVFDLPHGWTTIMDRGWATSVPLDRTLRIVVAPLVERTRADVRRVIARDLPPGARIDEIIPGPSRRSNAGWEMTSVTARIVDEAGNVLEYRDVTIYQVLWLIGAVMVVGREDEIERRQELLECVIPSGRPHMWTQEPASVADWFQMEPA